MQDVDLSKCSNCGNKLKPGYLLGKHFRIKWSSSSKGMTIFHGVPLNRLNKKPLLNWKYWLYAPSIPAMRCEKCKLVLFEYDNDEVENSRNEILASVIIGLALIILAGLLGNAAIFIGNLQLDWVLLLRFPFILLALVILGFGALFIKHAITINKA